MSNGRDRKVVEVQIGRPIRAESKVVARCHLDMPVVVEVPPHLDDGTPFPTLYWLTCPLAIARIGRLEGAGGVKRMEAKAVADPEFGQALVEAHDAYEHARNRLISQADGPQPSGGVGGTSTGVKCLHAHFAHHAAGGENPVGRLVEEWIGPLDCDELCVVDNGLNREWMSKP